AAHRPQGTAQVRVFTPGVPTHGWAANGRSVVEVVTDDMPFLVDSVTMALASLQHGVHVVVHPQFEVERDITGELRRVSAAADGATGDAGDPVLRESWMHVEIDRLADEADVETLVTRLHE